MGRPIVFVVSADVAVSDSIKALVESAGLPAETYRSLQMFLDAIITVLQADAAAQS